MRFLVLFSIFLGMLWQPAVAQTMTLTQVQSTGYSYGWFDAAALKNRFVEFVSNQAAAAQWLIRDGTDLPADQLGGLRVSLQYRYGLAYSQSGQAGSGGICWVSASGSSVNEQQLAALAVQVTVYRADKTILFSRQVEAVAGEDYPAYSNWGVSTPYAQYSQWRSANSGQFAQMAIQDRLAAVASAKAVQSLLVWWRDPVSAPYHCADQARPADCSNPELTGSRSTPVQQFGGPPSERRFEPLNAAERQRYQQCHGLVIWAKRGAEWQVLERVPVSALQFSANPCGVWVTRATPKQQQEHLQFEVP